MVTWVLELNVFSEVCFDRMVAHLKETGTPYETVRIIPFVHECPHPVRLLDGPVVCYGSIGIQKLAKSMGWAPGVWFDEESFSSTAYQQLGSLFLNQDARRVRLSKLLDHLVLCGIEEFFIKPDGDLKQFAGQVMQRDEFTKWHQQMVSIGYLEEEDFDVVISSIKEIGKEYRTVVVDGKIVATSRVRPTAQRAELPEAARAVVEEAISIYQPAPVFVADVCEVLVDWEGQHTEWKIIEYNNFNSAGLYECDIPSVMNAVSDYASR